MITEDTTADCSPTEDLRLGIQDQHWLVDADPDGQAILPKANQVEMRPAYIWPQKRENIREMTTKIETKGGRESKMRPGILNGGVEWPQVIAKIQTLFSSPFILRCIFLWATRNYIV